MITHAISFSIHCVCFFFFFVFSISLLGEMQLWHQYCDLPPCNEKKKSLAGELIAAMQRLRNRGIKFVKVINHLKFWQILSRWLTNFSRWWKKVFNFRLFFWFVFRWMLKKTLQTPTTVRTKINRNFPSDYRNIVGYHPGFRLGWRCMLIYHDGSCKSRAT